MVRIFTPFILILILIVILKNSEDEDEDENDFIQFQTLKQFMKTHLDEKLRVFTVELPGDLVSTNADNVRAQLGELLEGGGAKKMPWDTLRLELPRAQMVDSVGLNLVVSLLRAVQHRQGKMQVAYASPNILRTFQFTRLDKQIEMIAA